MLTLLSWYSDICWIYSRTPCGCVDWNYQREHEWFCNNRRTPCGCVDWNIMGIFMFNSANMSHPVWVRGLKLTWHFDGDDSLRRTPCGCVDWNFSWHNYCTSRLCRTPCGCVDWNISGLSSSLDNAVAPRVGAWIETKSPLRIRR